MSAATVVAVALLGLDLALIAFALSCDVRCWWRSGSPERFRWWLMKRRALGRLRASYSQVDGPGFASDREVERAECEAAWCGAMVAQLEELRALPEIQPWSRWLP